MSEGERKLLDIVELKKGFGSGETRQEVLRGISFSVAKGEFCVLLGPSGSGKSTLLNIIGGIDSADLLQFRQPIKNMLKFQEVYLDSFKSNCG